MSQRFPPHRGYAQRPSHPSRFEHSDRWNGRSSQRSRSPPTRDPRDRRDSRDFAPPPRDLPLDRAQRYLRDGPLSAGSNPPDSRYPPAPYNRGRGRPGDWDFRGRNRLPDERDAFRRSPSRGPRRERQGSVDSRDYDRRDERRDEFRDHREEEWRYRRQDFVRRDPPPRIDSRHASDARSDSMPSPVERIGRQPSPHRRQSPVDKRDYETPRRPSMIDHVSKDGRRDSERSEVIRQQRDRSPDRTQTRQAEETSSVAVPQFGFIPPVLATPVKAPVSPVPSSKTIPTAPRAQLSAIVPTGPKAERLPDRPITITKDPVPTAITEDTKPKEMLSLPIAVNVQPATSPPLSEPSIHESPSAFRTQSLEASPSFTVKQLIPPSAPTGPRSSSQPLGRASSAGPPVRDASPSASMANIPPLGPRGSIPQLPKGLPDNIPIGPRAMVMNRPPPTAPRNHRQQQATSWQWRSNEAAAPPRAPSIPAKRDANGEEKERTPVPERLFESARVGSSAPYSMDVRKPSDSPVKTFLTLGGYPEKLKLAANEDIRMTDVPSKGSPISPSAAKGYYSSDDDGDQGLTEEDFREQAEQYKQRRAELEAQREIFQRKHRATTPLQELDKGNAILAIVDEMRLPASPEPSPAPIADTTMTEEAPTKSPTPEEVPSPMRSASEAPVVASAPRELTPEMSKSPDFEYLPYLPERPPTPISNPEQLEDVTDDDLQNLIDSEIQEMEHEDDEKQTTLQEQFRSLYNPWKRNAVILDREREIVETEVTQSKIEIDIPEPSVEQPVTPLPTPTESRRLHKYSSELDLERALEESRLLEELRQQKAERDKLEAAANVEREAEVPTLLTEHEIELRNFKDTSLLRNAEESLRVFEFAPPEDTLTPEQSREFTKLWKKHPKMWHLIADSLHLTTKECIYHYYATKWDKPYKGGKARKPKRPTLGNTRRGLIGARGRLEVDTDTPDTAVGLTETGRPRRAAAPVFSKPTMGKGGDLEAETDSPAPSGKRTTGNKTDNGITEGRGGGRGKVAKDKPARKPRNQPLVAKTSAVSSPQKVARERKDKAASVTPALTGEGEEWTGKRESVPPQERLMPILVPQQQQQQLQQPLLQTYAAEPPNMHMYREANSNLTPLDHPPGVSQIPVSQRSRSHSNTQKANASSYWSVTEETEFQACLTYYGTDFQQIAAHINKKTPVMIKNHYQKYRQDESKRDIIAAAERANQRRERGESLGELPGVLKKSLHVQQSLLRPLMPNDPMDTESPPSAPTVVNLVHGSPSFRPQLAFPGMQPHSTPPSKVAMPTHGVPGPISGSGPNQPRLGYFHESPARPQQSHSQPHGQPHGQPHMSPPMMMQEPARSAKSSRIKTEHNAHHVHQPLNRERSTRGDALTTVQMEQAIPPGLAPYPQVSNPNPTPIRLVQQSYQANQTFGGKELLPEGSRKAIDSTGPSASGYDKFSSSMPSGESRDYSRYQTQNITPPAHPRPRDPPPATAEPRRVNIMSMLNPEPSEEKPQKQPEPQPQPRPHHAPEQVSFQQRDLYGRESHHRPTSSIHDRDVGVPSSSQREPVWPVNRSYGPPSHHYSDSPRLAPQPDYRTAALGQLNTHTRSVHSPPPGGAYHHSRTSSYSTANQPQQHGSNPSSAAGTPTEPYPRSSLSRNPAFGSGPLAAAQNTQPHHSSSYAPLPPDRRDMDPNSSQFSNIGLRAFRNQSSHDYDSQAPPPGQPGATGAPPPSAPPSSHHRQPYGSSGGGPPSQSHHPSHSSPQPPADPRYTAPPPAVSRGPQPMSYDQRGVPAPMPPHATDQRYAEEMRRREDEMRRSGGPGGPPPHPGQQQAPRRY